MAKSIDSFMQLIYSDGDSENCGELIPGADDETQAPEGIESQQNSTVVNLDQQETQETQSDKSQSLLGGIHSPSVTQSTKKQRTAKGAKGKQDKTVAATAKKGTNGGVTITPSGRKGRGKKRMLSGDQAADGATEEESVLNAISESESASVAKALNRLANEIGCLSRRLDRIESNLDIKVKTQVQNQVQKVVENIKVEFSAEITKIREEMNALKTQNSACAQQSSATVTENRSMNIVIRNLPDILDLQVHETVNMFLSDTLKINIAVESAERKPSRPGEPGMGVIVAKCKSREDKSVIMNAKSGLRFTEQYKHTFIEHDRPKHARNNMSNLKTIANMIGTDRVMLRGSRLVPKGDDVNHSWDTVTNRNIRTTNNTRRPYGQWPSYNRRSSFTYGQPESAEQHRPRDHQSNNDRRRSDYERYGSRGDQYESRNDYFRSQNEYRRYRD